MYLGIDCGTQGTKVVVCDSSSLQVIGKGYSQHDMISDANGRREQPVEWWINALKQAIQQALSAVDKDNSSIKAIGVSGQQHGMVLLDERDIPLYPAKLWCDTETSLEAKDLINESGGVSSQLEHLGIVLQTGYTASKIRWFARHYPEQYQKVAKIMLPHDYLNYWMTGSFVSEFGDASGTGYFNTYARDYDDATLALIAPNLTRKKLPQLINAEQHQGRLSAKAAKELGLPEGILVSSGGGDNMMGAIGTGNIEPGIVTMSLGTSGTLYAYSDQPVIDPDGLIANFCSSSNGWLPLICTMNVTASTSRMQYLFNLNLEQFTNSLLNTEPGANGVTLLPFFNGERVPILPNATASILGLTSENLTVDNLIRATTEAATFSLRYGLDLFRQQGLKPTEIRLIGGGAKNPVWRQMVADVMDTPVICPVEHEAAALGAAIQAMWCYQNKQQHSILLKTLCQQWVKFDPQSVCQPIARQVIEYEIAYQRYKKYLTQLHS